MEKSAKKEQGASRCQHPLPLMGGKIRGRRGTSEPAGPSGRRVGRVQRAVAEVHRLLRRVVDDHRRRPVHPHRASPISMELVRYSQVVPTKIATPQKPIYHKQKTGVNMPVNKVNGHQTTTTKPIFYEF